MMAHRPLVSVLMPCYNSAKTLPIALASTVAQDYPHWECIVVDDGSSDHPETIVDRVNDARIRLLRSPVNRGRGASRQLALENAAGQYVCMLDADDWHYPNRLSSQVAVLEARPELALVTAGMAIVDRDGALQGIRGLPPAGSALTTVSQKRRPCSPYFPYPPSMMRTAVAREYPYDAKLRIVEDLDMLVRFSLDHSAVWMPEVIYVYSEDSLVQHGKYYESQRGARRVYRKHRRVFPVSSRIAIGETILKETIYRTAASLGLSHFIMDHRSRAANQEEVFRFQRSKQLMESLVDDQGGYCDRGGQSLMTTA